MMDSSATSGGSGSGQDPQCCKRGGSCGCGGGYCGKYDCALAPSREAAPQIKKWQERVGTPGFELGRVTFQGDGAKLAARDAEIADLRAALAQQAIRKAGK